MNIPRKKKPCKCGNHEGYLFSHGYTVACWFKLRSKTSPTLKRTVIRKAPIKNSGKPGKKPQPKIKKFSAKKLAFIKLCLIYYKEAIRANIIRNEGKCLCDNCNGFISHENGTPGSLVCHIVSAGSNNTMREDSVYLDKRNHFILGRGEIFGECDCKADFDDRGKKKHMKIWPRFLEIRRIINLEYYS